MLAKVNGISLFYKKTGEGPPVLLLHGNGETHRIFDVLIRDLEKSHTVYALDSRGHGQSGGGTELSYDRMAEDTAAFIQTLGLRSPALYGFSDGGIIGLLVACRYPGLLGKLAVSGANLTPDGLKPVSRFFIGLNYLFTRSKRVKIMLTQPRITEGELRKIQIPVLVLAGERDLIKEEHTRLIARSIPGSTLEILRGEAHGTYVVHSKKLYPVLWPFLEQE